MPTANQISTMIESALRDHDILKGDVPGKTATFLSDVSEKIVALFDDNGSILVAAAALENEVTSTLMDMLAATILATVIEEEGGGRSNISYSPMSMDHMMQHYIYEVNNDGLIRTVRITLREDSDLQNEAAWREPSNRHGLVDAAPPEAGVIGLVTHPQAEPKEHNRPLWVIRNARGSLFSMADQADAERQLRGAKVAVPHQRAMSFENDPLATIENRWCLHPNCPSTGCNLDPEKRDKPEATSDDSDVDNSLA